VEVTESNLQWAMEKFQMFYGRQGFPENPQAITAHARALLRLVYNEAKKHSKLGEVNDADWLLETAFEQTDRFPQPPFLRALYSRYFKPAVEIEELVVE
jgi:hypothetical protein